LISVEDDMARGRHRRDFVRFGWQAGERQPARHALVPVDGDLVFYGGDDYRTDDRVRTESAHIEDIAA
jgi:hypothetical protein